MEKRTREEDAWVVGLPEATVGCVAAGSGGATAAAMGCVAGGFGGAAVAVLDGPAVAFACCLGGAYLRFLGQRGSSALWAWPQFLHRQGWGQFGEDTAPAMHRGHTWRWFPVAWLPAQCMHLTGA